MDVVAILQNVAWQKVANSKQGEDLSDCNDCRPVAMLTWPSRYHHPKNISKNEIILCCFYHNTTQHCLLQSWTPACTGNRWGSVTCTFEHRGAGVQSFQDNFLKHSKQSKYCKSIAGQPQSRVHVCQGIAPAATRSWLIHHIISEINADAKFHFWQQIDGNNNRSIK